MKFYIGNKINNKNAKLPNEYTKIFKGKDPLL